MDQSSLPKKKKLLVVNFEMDRWSPSMSWSQELVTRLATYFDEVIVQTQKIGVYNPPKNVFLHIIPFSRFNQIPVINWGVALMANIQTLTLIRNHKIDLCFIHMASNWSYILFPALKFFNIKIVLWYAHGAVSPSLKKAVFCANRVLTSSQQGCRIASPKVSIIGQGVNTDLFRPRTNRVWSNNILSVSRISKSKKIHEMISLMAYLKSVGQSPPVRLRVIGSGVTKGDDLYKAKIIKTIRDLGLEDVVEWVGFVPQEHIPQYYNEAFLHINLSQTNSMDKSVLEALASGCPVLTSNRAFQSIFMEFPEFFLTQYDSISLGLLVIQVHQRQNLYDPQKLRSIVLGNHDIHTHMARLLENFSSLLKERNG